MPVFMKMNGIDSVGGTHSARDGTSNTLMIMEKVPAAPSPGPPAANFGNAGGEAEIGVRKGEWILDWTRDGGASLETSMPFQPRLFPRRKPSTYRRTPTRALTPSTRMW